MSVLQYVGARYVPKLFDDGNGGMEWKADTYYEPLTIVTYNNTSYISRVPVSPSIGNPASNGEYWAESGNFNAFVAELRNMILALNTALETKSVDILTEKVVDVVGNALNIEYYEGQGQTPSPTYIVQTIHNYTDARGIQVDNVGAGANIVLRQAGNASRRPDKPSDYVGTGPYLVLSRDKSGSITVQNDGNVNHAMREEGNAAPYTILDMRAQGNISPSYNIGRYYAPGLGETAIFSIMYRYNAPLFLFTSYQGDAGQNDARILSGTETTGLRIKASKGNVEIAGENAAHVLVDGNHVLTSRTIVNTAMQGDYVGEVRYNTALHKPLWWDGTAWRDASGATT